MTLHAAKGLEFQTVFVVGNEQGILPFYDEKTPTDTDEERRLLYVGMTRARRQLVLTHARKRLRYGKTVRLARSEFLDNLAQELIREKHAKVRQKKEEKDEAQTSLF